MHHITLVYPRWPKIPEQKEFHLPPHGPICVAAEIPEEFQITFVDENVDTLDPDQHTDVVLLSMMLSCQTPRGKEIAELYRSKGVKVIAGGIATMLHSDEIAQHVDSVFLGEVEDGRLATVLNDWKNEHLQATYDFFHDFPPIESVGPANRTILKDELYTYRGVRMVDLFHASRGCKFNCFPCSTAYLGGRQFRPRPVEKVVEELGGIDNNRLFFVDNSLAQDREWLLELFEAIAPLKKKWVSHPILDDDEVLAKAAEAGAWYVYQAIFDTSDVMRNRVRRLKEYGIGVEAAVLLGPDNQDVDYIKRLVDFLLEIDVDMAEFSILTPFPHAPVTKQFEEQNRILHKDWSRYTTAEVVYKPKHMTPDELQEMYHYAWDNFYGEMSQSLRMSRLFMKVVHAEIADNSYQSTLRLNERRQWHS
jgi:radical SAM superfamily enzyme YgiQ (UPF0313 family)